MKLKCGESHSACRECVGHPGRGPFKECFVMYYDVVLRTYANGINTMKTDDTSLQG